MANGQPGGTNTRATKPAPTMRIEPGGIREHTETGIREILKMNGWLQGRRPGSLKWISR